MCAKSPVHSSKVRDHFPQADFTGLVSSMSALAIYHLSKWWKRGSLLATVRIGDSMSVRFYRSTATLDLAGFVGSVSFRTPPFVVE